jgi:hypothetical protein
MTSGWNDMYGRGDLQLLDKLKTPRRLVMDASTHHGAGQAGHVGAPYTDAPVGLDPSLNTPFDDKEVKAWLDRSLLGKKTGAERMPRLRSVDLADGSWHEGPPGARCRPAWAPRSRWTGRARMAARRTPRSTRASTTRTG